MIEKIGLKLKYTNRKAGADETECGKMGCVGERTRDDKEAIVGGRGGGVFGGASKEA